jgi:hypothetical protein
MTSKNETLYTIDQNNKSGKVITTIVATSKCRMREKIQESQAAIHTTPWMIEWPIIG